MGSFSKQKGKRGEREAVKLLQPILSMVCEELGIEEVKLFRNQNQSFEGGYDIDGLGWLALEVKRCETLQVKKWWEQTVGQAGEGQEPLLVYRKSRMKWRAMMWGWVDIKHLEQGLRVPIDIDVESLLEWFEKRVRNELACGLEGPS